MRKILDQIVIERALKFGFKLHPNGRPFWHFSVDSNAFLGRLERGELFYDNLGFIFIGPHLNEGLIFHGRRSHAMQALFLSEYIPDFIDAYKHIGRTADSLFWSNYFDSPFSNDITNNALFMTYLANFLMRASIF